MRCVRGPSYGGNKFRRQTDSSNDNRLPALWNLDRSTLTSPRYAWRIRKARCLGDAAVVMERECVSTCRDYRWLPRNRLVAENTGRGFESPMCRVAHKKGLTRWPRWGWRRGFSSHLESYERRRDRRAWY